MHFCIEFSEFTVSRLRPDKYSSSEEACHGLQQDAINFWRNGRFFNCSLLKAVKIARLHNVQHIHIFGITVNTDRLRKDHQNLKEFELAWLVNRMVNLNQDKCKTTTELASRKSEGNSSEFIINGLYDNGLCNHLLTRQRISERVYVLNCKLVQRSAKPIHGIYIGQYSIHIRKRLRYLRVPTYILRELNRGLPNCRYDGYWASTGIQTTFISP
ncbi:hypothetical protein CRM22_009196 [Opisthorchis felineus]|uniref:Uncharacterized protein n=1 Tax=Opisthorchis felineus TaxID=147828 RepID=A0A4S2L8F0_OPIFE|nr:hypothetical protein CRM22_009196 [Opisthorchis felineus]